MKLPSPQSEGCAALALHLRLEHIGFTPEFRFHPVRKWRADFCLAKGILVEVDGGNHMVKQNPFTGRFSAVGRHTKDEDYRKLNAAAQLGYRVLRFSPAMVKSGEAIATIKAVINGES